jgi:hypothetical protein
LQKQSPLSQQCNSAIAIFLFFPIHLTAKWYWDQAAYEKQK